MILTEKKNRVLMRINGQEYPIAGKESKEYLIRVGTFVDEKMLEISRINRQLSLSQVAVLTTINVADQLLKLQDDYAALQQSKPPTSAELEALQHDLEQKTGSLQQEKEYTRNLQKRVNILKQEQEKLRESHQEISKQLTDRDGELGKAHEIIKDLQEQLFQNQIKVAELEKRQGEQLSFLSDDKDSLDG